MTKTKAQQEIEKLVDKYSQYSQPENRDIFRLELEHLVLIAEREQLVADQEATMQIIKGEENTMRIIRGETK